MDDSVAAIALAPLPGAEPFHVAGATAGFDVSSLWRWAASDLASNVWRAYSPSTLSFRRSDAKAWSKPRGTRVTFQLALLTEAETLRLNKLNRSQIATDRLASAGIRLIIPSAARAQDSE